MKFGKRLAAEAARRWRPYYLDYKACKRAIQQDVHALGTPSVVCKEAASNRLASRGVCGSMAGKVAGAIQKVAEPCDMGLSFDKDDGRGCGPGTDAPPCAGGGQTLRGAGLRRCCGRSSKRSARSIPTRRTSWRWGAASSRFRMGIVAGCKRGFSGPAGALGSDAGACISPGIAGCDIPCIAACSRFRQSWCRSWLQGLSLLFALCLVVKTCISAG